MRLRQGRSGDDHPQRTADRGGAARAPHRLARPVARPGGRVQLAEDGGADPVSRRFRRLPLRLRHPAEPRGPPDRAARHVCRAEEFHPGFQRSDLLAGGVQHLRLHGCRHPVKDGRRARPRAGDEPALPDEEPGARAVAAAVHRADRAEARRLDVDARPGIQHLQLVFARAGLAKARTVLARQPLSGDGLDHRHQPLARAARLWNHAARRVADRTARTLRGRDDRRRQRLAALPLCDAALAAADHYDRHAVLGDLHLRRLPAGLCADPWRAAERDPPVRDLRLRHRHGRRAARPRRFGRADDAAGAGIADPGADPLHAETVMVTGHGRVERMVRVWLPVGFFMLLALFPFYWMAITSVKPNAELYNRNMMPLLVHNPTLKHYVGLLTETSFLLWTWNTLLVAVVSTAISLVFGTMLAYPLARMRFAGAGLIAMRVAPISLVPQPLLFLPLADVINRLDLGNTLTAVMLTYPTMLVPFCAWLLIGYFKTVPKELEEAAR